MDIEATPAGEGSIIPALKHYKQELSNQLSRQVYQVIVVTLGNKNFSDERQEIKDQLVELAKLPCSIILLDFTDSDRQFFRNLSRGKFTNTTGEQIARDNIQYWRYDKDQAVDLGWRANLRIAQEF